MEKQKETVIYDSKGPSGNIFAIIGQVGTVLKKQRRINDYNELWSRVNACESYEEALSIINEYVRLVDIQKQSEIEM